MVFFKICSNYLVNRIRDNGLHQGNLSLLRKRKLVFELQSVTSLLVSIFSYLQSLLANEDEVSVICQISELFFIVLFQ